MRTTPKLVSQDTSSPRTLLAFIALPLPWKSEWCVSTNLDEFDQSSCSLTPFPAVYCHSDRLVLTLARSRKRRFRSEELKSLGSAARARSTVSKTGRLSSSFRSEVSKRIVADRNKNKICP